MKKRLRVHPAAAAELVSAAEWYELKQSGLGYDLQAKVEETLAALTSGFLGGSRILGRRSLRRIVLKRFPYDVVFLSRRDEVIVIAFAHHARKPGYWRHRLRT